MAYYTNIKSKWQLWEENSLKSVLDNPKIFLVFFKEPRDKLEAVAHLKNIGFYKNYKSRTTPKVSKLYKIWNEKNYLEKVIEEGKYKTHSKFNKEYMSSYKKIRDIANLNPYFEYLDNKKINLSKKARKLIKLFFELDETRKLQVFNIHSDESFFEMMTKAIVQTLIGSWLEKPNLYKSSFGEMMYRSLPYVILVKRYSFPLIFNKKGYLNFNQFISSFYLNCNLKPLTAKKRRKVIIKEFEKIWKDIPKTKKEHLEKIQEFEREYNEEIPKLDDGGDFLKEMGVPNIKKSEILSRILSDYDEVLLEIMSNLLENPFKYHLLDTYTRYYEISLEKLSNLYEEDFFKPFIMKEIYWNIQSQDYLIKHGKNTLKSFSEIKLESIEKILENNFEPSKWMLNVVAEFMDFRSKKSKKSFLEKETKKLKEFEEYQKNKALEMFKGMNYKKFLEEYSKNFELKQNH